MTPQHPRWGEFIALLEGPGGCDFRQDPDLVWRCAGGADQHYARRILGELGLNEDAIQRSLAFFRQNGAECDCEIVLNIGWRTDRALRPPRLDA